MADMSEKMAAMRAAAEAKKGERETAVKEAESAKSREAAERAAKREAVTAERDRVTGEAANTRAELAALKSEMGDDLDPAMVAEIQNDLAGLDAKAAELDAQIAASESGSVQLTTEATQAVEAGTPETPKEAVHEPAAEAQAEMTVEDLKKEEDRKIKEQEKAYADSRDQVLEELKSDILLRAPGLKQLQKEIPNIRGWEFQRAMGKIVDVATIDAVNEKLVRANEKTGILELKKDAAVKSIREKTQEAVAKAEATKQAST